MRGSAEERFWSKVDKSGDCWVWIASTSSKGYGKFWFRNWHWRAHRVSWILANGEIPEGMHILHECDNPPCVNPDHLTSGTQLDNMKDKVQKGRHYETKKTHCLRGHPFSGSNLHIISSSGKRRCRECDRIRHRKLFRE